KDVQDARAQLGSGRGNARLAASGAVADTSEHIAQGISHCHVPVSLPARLDDARHLAEIAQFAKRNTRHLEFAIECARAARDFATVANAGLGAVARHFGKLQGRLEALLDRESLVLDDRLEGGALGSLA